MTGAVGFLLRFIGPLTVTPIVTLIGLSLFDTIPGLAEHNWWIALGYSYIHDTQVYIPKRRTLIQVLPLANAYPKSAHAYIHFAKLFCYLLMHVCIFIAIRPVCVHHDVRIGCLNAILRQNAYMHEQIK